MPPFRPKIRPRQNAANLLKQGRSVICSLSAIDPYPPCRLKRKDKPRTAAPTPRHCHVSNHSPHGACGGISKRHWEGTYQYENYATKQHKLSTSLPQPPAYKQGKPPTLASTIRRSRAGDHTDQKEYHQHQHPHPEWRCGETTPLYGTGHDSALCERSQKGTVSRDP